MAEPVIETAPSPAAVGGGGPVARSGTLRVYLGAAPGVGKTFAMLREGRARRSHGEDVVVAFVETYGRPRTVEAIGNLEVLPRLRVPYRGTVLEEMDVDAVLARRPQVALVDELAHTNATGVRHAKRWEDVEEIRDAGIDVITTVNVQHLESVKDLVETITGIPVRETVPDRVVDSADEIQFIDISPQALRKRMRHGNIYPRERVEAALGNFFREGNLGALREIALRLVAQKVGSTTTAVRAAPQDVLVAVSGRPSSEALIRRAARLARRTDGLCSVVIVTRPATPPTTPPPRWRVAAEQVSATVVERVGDDVVRAVEEVARELLVTHVVIGEARPPGLLARWRRTVADRLVEDLPDLDIHVLARHAHGRRRERVHPEDERPEPDELLRRLHAAGGPHGSLRIHLGYARGCGTTIAMLDEARRRQSRGTDVVVATLATPEREACQAAAQGLELLGGPRGPAARGVLDVDALLARNPQVACIDELAGVDTDGLPVSQALEQILAAGITVIATLRLTDLRSTAEGLAGIVPRDPTRPLVDDSVLALADEIELLDVTPSVLGERLRRGDIVPPAGVARLLQTEFRPQTLAALRELAFRVIAEHTDRRLLVYMRERGIEQPWEARPRVLACVPPRPGMERLLKAASRLADRIDGEFRAVTVRTRARSEDEKRLLGSYAALAHQLGGEFVTLRSRSVAPALAAYAQENFVTEMVVTRGRPARRRLRRTALRELIRITSDVDIHVMGERPD